MYGGCFMLAEKIWELKGEIEFFFDENPSVYIYGAGKYADILCKLIMELGLKPECVLVTDITKSVLSVQGIRVLEYNPNFRYDASVIIAVNSKYHKEILPFVKDTFDDTFILPDAFFESLNQIYNIEYESEQGIWIKGGSLALMLDKICRKRTVVIQRFGGIGDVLSVEPLCRKLKEDGYYVGIATYYTELFSYNHSVDFRLNMMFSDFIMDNTIFICLDNMYEVRPFCHILDAYLDCANHFFIDAILLDSLDRIPDYDNSLIREHNNEIKSICINIEASNWKSRMVSKDRITDFAKYLIGRQYKIYEIGSNPENYLGVGEDCFGLSLHESVELMSETDLYIGVDNGLMHLAQAIRLPIFVLFGCVCPIYRIHDWSRARVMWKNLDELPCAACYHRRMIPCREPKCHWDTVRCMDWTVEEVIEAFETEKYDNPPKLQDEMYKPIWWNDIS